SGSFIYVADDRATGSGGGLQRYDYNSSSSAFQLSYTLNSGLGTGSNSGLRGLTVDLNSAGGPTIYAITGETPTATAGNKLVSVQDTGAGSAFATLATAAGNTAF